MHTKAKDVAVESIIPPSNMTELSSKKYIQCSLHSKISRSTCKTDRYVAALDWSGRSCLYSIIDDSLKRIARYTNQAD